jgi:hypothetical protein
LPWKSGGAGVLRRGRNHERRERARKEEELNHNGSAADMDELTVFSKDFVKWTQMDGDEEVF